MLKDVDTTKSLYDKGQLADLTEYISKDGIELAAYNGLAENFKMPDGKVVGMPVRTDYYVLYYNKDIFDAASVAYPTNDMTWADFEETAKKITSSEGAAKKYGALIHTWQACVENWGDVRGDHRQHLEEYGLFHDHLPCSPAGHPAFPVRGGHYRRRVRHDGDGQVPSRTAISAGKQSPPGIRSGPLP